MRRWKIVKTGGLDESCLLFSVVWGVMSVGLLFSFGLNIITFVCIVIFCGLFYAFVMDFCGIVPADEDKDDASSVSLTSAELVKKSRDYLDELEFLKKEVDLPSFGPMFDVLSRLIEKQKRIHSVLQKHPERARLIRHFITYYLDQTVKFAKVYQKIDELHSSSTNDAIHAMGIVRKLKLFFPAYDEAIRKVTEEDSANLEAELSVADSMLSADGFPVLHGKEGEDSMPKETAVMPDDLVTDCLSRTQTLLDFVISYNDDELPPAFPSLVKKQRRILVSITKDKPLALQIRRHLEYYLPKTIQLVSFYTKIKTSSKREEGDLEYFAKISGILSSFEDEYDAALKKILPSQRSSLDAVLSDAEDNLVADGLRPKMEDSEKNIETIQERE